MMPLDFEILGTLYRLGGDARLRSIYSTLTPEKHRDGESKKIKRHVHKLCETGAIERTPSGSYLITPKGRGIFLRQLTEIDPESLLLRRRKLLVTAKVEALEEGGYLAVCEDIRGCHAEGETVAEALANLEDVARIVLELRRDEGWPLPEDLEEYQPDRTLTTEVVVALPE